MRLINPIIPPGSRRPDRERPARDPPSRKRDPGEPAAAAGSSASGGDGKELGSWAQEMDQGKEEFVDNNDGYGRSYWGPPAPRRHRLDFNRMAAEVRTHPDTGRVESHGGARPKTTAYTCSRAEPRQDTNGSQPGMNGRRDRRQEERVTTPPLPAQPAPVPRPNTNWIPAGMERRQDRPVPHSWYGPGASAKTAQEGWRKLRERKQAMQPVATEAAWSMKPKDVLQGMGWCGPMRGWHQAPPVPQPPPEPVPSTSGLRALRTQQQPTPPPPTATPRWQPPRRKRPPKPVRQERAREELARAVERVPRVDEAGRWSSASAPHTRDRIQALMELCGVWKDGRADQLALRYLLEDIAHVVRADLHLEIGDAAEPNMAEVEGAPAEVAPTGVSIQEVVEEDEKGEDEDSGTDDGVAEVETLVAEVSLAEPGAVDSVTVRDSPPLEIGCLYLGDDQPVEPEPMEAEEDVAVPAPSSECPVPTVDTLCGEDSLPSEGLLEETTLEAERLVMDLSEEPCSLSDEERLLGGGDEEELPHTPSPL